MCACVCELHAPMGTWIPSHIDPWARALTWVRALTWTRGHGPMGTWIPSLSCKCFVEHCPCVALCIYVHKRAHTHTHTHTQLWNWMKSSIFPERIDGIEYRCCPHCGAAIVKNGGYLCVRRTVGRTVGGVFCVCLHVFGQLHTYMFCAPYTWYVRRCAPLAYKPPVHKQARARAQTSSSARTHKHTHVP